MNNKAKGRKTTVDPQVGERLFMSTFREQQEANKPPTNTLRGKVSLIRVNDIRRSLRIRYAARTNIQKLFETYDEGSKGYVDAFDIYEQSKHLGIKINIDEAQVLIQSAKEKESEAKGLGVKEFEQLMFNCVDQMDVDLGAL